MTFTLSASKASIRAGTLGGFPKISSQSSVNVPQDGHGQWAPGGRSDRNAVARRIAFLRQEFELDCFGRAAWRPALPSKIFCHRWFAKYFLPGSPHPLEPAKPMKSLVAPRMRDDRFREVELLKATSNFPRRSTFHNRGWPWLAPAVHMPHPDLAPHPQGEGAWQ
jgi:hypothetical protein